MQTICITFDKDGKEAYKEEYDDGYIPKNGFQHVGNNVYHKKLGDPRCITDTEKRRALEENEKRTLLSVLPPVHNFPQPKQSRLQQALDKALTPINNVPSLESGCTRFVQAQSRTSLDAFLFAQINGCVIRSKDGKIVTVHGPDMISSLGFKELNPDFTFLKIEVNTIQKAIGIWYDSSGLLPDVIITDAIE
jgi:hypothetical protein